MSRKNSTIIAIAVHPKLSIGDKFYRVGYSGVTEIELTTKPFWYSYKSFPGGHWEIGFKSVSQSEGSFNKTMILADEGFTGFVYDDRPNRLVKNAEDIVQAQMAYDAWLDLSNQEAEFYTRSADYHDGY
ncbi:hypothetical protein ST201phi2-1p393 [Pseudomonas phage 201phi2-1]|uniref:Uncharacterized protein n=1 Tax=Pseudomonas phage 201phi2-1 TaxID=198110 RepID=B3FJQ2_BP201|nr:hypothetical protein ST201phi2-1p393 [Pseudomonas phage 201phi2-1]ABY63217.1 hypothetical protein 201phi2-1p393 [Pseudomonas phage 201phi2-1]